MLGVSVERYGWDITFVLGSFEGPIKIFDWIWLR